jgi:hypothetical protein
MLTSYLEENGDVTTRRDKAASSSPGLLNTARLEKADDAAAEDVRNAYLSNIARSSSDVAAVSSASREAPPLRGGGAGVTGGIDIGVGDLERKRVFVVVVAAVDVVAGFTKKIPSAGTTTTTGARV